MRKIIVSAVVAGLVGLIGGGTASAYTTKPAHGKALMCYQYQPGSWTTVYVPESQIDNRLEKGDYLFGECGPA